MSDKIQQQLALAGQYARAGAYADAQKTLRKVITKAPANVGAWLLLGQICGLQNAHAEAEQAFARAAKLNPRSLDAHAYLGIACMQQGKDQQAIAAFKAALAIQPNLVMALANLVGLLHKLERQREALPYQERWLAAEPFSASAHYTAAVLYQTLHQLTEARKHYQQVLALGAVGSSVYSTQLNLGVVCYGLRDFAAAIAHSRQALASKPDCAVSYYNIGNAQKEQGKHDEAIASFEQAVKFDPAFAEAHSNILFCMNYSDSYDAQKIYARHVEWAGRHALPHIAHASYSNACDPPRPLRIGYVSADFREHPVGFFLGGVLPYHSANCEIYCYFNSTQEDAITARLRAHVAHWRQISALDDDAVAAMIRADGIDILVDLSGHTSGNRLPVFARKPAPVQATWLGYCNTSGLSNMDYLLADAGVIPFDANQRFSEQVLRLPGSYLCYVAPDYAPAVAAPPSVVNGYVTFGCFNNLSKVTDVTLALWVEILHRVPEARFILKSKQLADPAVQQRYRDWFNTHGIASERVILDGSYLDHPGLLGYYNKIDIALDTYPYSGVTTTCEALWMGVPVVTLAGEKFISRNSAALLANVGLTELIAATPQRYVETAVALAAGSAHLAQLRSAQRERFKASPLGNAPLFAQNLETAYRDMWQKWCASAH